MRFQDHSHGAIPGLRGDSADSGRLNKSGLRHIMDSKLCKCAEAM